jgi:hypothetical protein
MIVGKHENDEMALRFMISSYLYSNWLTSILLYTPYTSSVIILRHYGFHFIFRLSRAELHIYVSNKPAEILTSTTRFKVSFKLEVLQAENNR